MKQTEKQTTQYFQELPNKLQKHAHNQIRKKLRCGKENIDLLMRKLQNFRSVPPAIKHYHSRSDLQLVVIPEVPKTIEDTAKL